MSLPECCFCHKPVFGLAGQREYLLLDHLRACDEQLKQERAFGEAHGYCLHQSRYGASWSQARFEYMHVTRGRESLGRGQDVSGTYSADIDEFRLYWDSGYSLCFQGRHFQGARRLAGGASLPMSQEVNLSFPGEFELLEEVSRALEADGRYPLLRYMEHRGQVGLVMYSELLKEAHLSLEEGLLKYWTEESISCLADYSAFVPESGLLLMRDFGVKAAEEVLARAQSRDIEPTAVQPMAPVETKQALKPCCFCGAPVLELEGQYARLGEDMLEPNDFPLRRAGIGTAHTRCLLGEGAGLAWSVRISEHLQREHSYRFRRRLNKVHALWDPENEETHLLWEDGYALVVCDDELEGLGPADVESPYWKKVLPRQTSLLLDLRQHPDLQAKVQRRLEVEGAYPLWDLVTGLGLADKVLHAKETLQGGVVRLDGPAESPWPVRVEYMVHLPNDGHRVAGPDRLPTE